MNKYGELQKKHQSEFNDFPMVFAFGNAQVKEGLKKLGLEPADTDMVYNFGYTGGFYRRSDAAALNEMLDRHEQERQEAIAGDTTGDGYIFDMFDYELANHEYGWTGDLEDTLDAIGLTMEEINKDPRMVRGLKKAQKNQIG